MTTYKEFDTRSLTWNSIYDTLVDEYLTEERPSIKLTVEAIEEWMLETYGIKITTVNFRWDTAGIPSDQLTFLLLRAGAHYEAD